MTSTSAAFQYKQAVTTQASVTGLVVALHDTLVGNLRRAAQAIEVGDIPTRCKELVHGFKVLQQLDSMLDMEQGGATAASVHRFYAYTRGQMLKAQFTLSSSLLYEQIRSVLEVRQAWQQLDSAPAPTQQMRYDRESSSSSRGMSAEDLGEARVSFSCEG